MKLPDTIAGMDARSVRDLLAALMARDTDYEWVDGLPKLIPRRVTIKLIGDSLGLSNAEAARVQRDLVAEGWIDHRHAPTTRGMALAQHHDRPPLPRAEAEAVISEVIAWAERVNAESDGRVALKTIHLFGSMLGDAPEVGDVDLFVAFTTMDHRENVEPEDIEREDELCRELADISEYVSASDEVDRAMLGASQRLIFPAATDRDGAYARNGSTVMAANSDETPAAQGSKNVV